MISVRVNHLIQLFSLMALYGGRVALARELKLISADQMSHIQKVADEALEDWKTFFL